MGRLKRNPRRPRGISRRGVLLALLLVSACRSAPTASDDARLRTEYWLVPSVGAPTDEETLDQAFEVRDGIARLTDSALS